MYVKVCHVHFLEDIHVRRRVRLSKGCTEMKNLAVLCTYVRTYMYLSTPDDYVKFFQLGLKRLKERSNNLHSTFEFGHKNLGAQ